MLFHGINLLRLYSNSMILSSFLIQMLNKQRCRFGNAIIIKFELTITIDAHEG